MAIIKPIGKNSLSELDSLFGDELLMDAWEEFDSSVIGNFLKVNHKERYCVRCIGPILPVLKFTLKKNNPIRKFLDRDQIQKLVSGESICYNGGSKPKLREAILEIGDQSKWEKCLMTNVMVRDGTSNLNLIGKVCTHVFTRGALATMPKEEQNGGGVLRNGSSGPKAYDIVINKGMLRFDKSLANLRSDEFRAVFEQGLYDLSTCVEEVNNESLTGEKGDFYRSASNRRFSDSYVNDIRHAFSVLEEGKEIQHLLNNPEELKDIEGFGPKIIDLIHIK